MLITNILQVVAWLLKEILKIIFGRRVMLQKIASLNHHGIVCGDGRVGKQVIAGLQKSGNSFVVIEGNPEKVESLFEDNIMAICGDAKLD
jgi:voltage-gated potassium channel Kch